MERTVGSTTATAWAWEQTVGDPLSKLMLLSLAASCGSNVVPLTSAVVERTEIEAGDPDLSALTALLDLQSRGLVRLYAELSLPE